MAASVPAFFVGDSTGLDFLNSVATPVDLPVDWIADGDGLLRWLAQADLVPAAALEELRKAAVPGELDAVAAQARALREWFRAFVLAHKGATLNPRDVTELLPINRLLSRDQSYLEVAPAMRLDEGQVQRFELQRHRRWTAPEALLLPIAEALAKVVSEEDFSHIKACEGSACTLLFADHTKGHRRRWCSMAVCGNRAKQLAHYRRRNLS